MPMNLQPLLLQILLPSSPQVLQVKNTMGFIGWEYLKLVVKCPSFPSPKAAKVLHGSGWGFPTKSRANYPVSKVLKQDFQLPLDSTSMKNY